MESTRLLSVEELRRWVRPKLKRGVGSGLRDYGRELPTLAFTRAIGITDPNFFEWLCGNRTLPRRVQINFSKFVALWDSGMIEFSEGENRKRILVHRKTPRPMPLRARVEFDGGAPRISMHARPRPPERLPTARNPLLDRNPKTSA